MKIEKTSAFFEKIFATPLFLPEIIRFYEACFFKTRFFLFVLCTCALTLVASQSLRACSKFSREI